MNPKIKFCLKKLKDGTWGWFKLVRECYMPTGVSFVADEVYFSSFDEAWRWFFGDAA